MEQINEYTSTALMASAADVLQSHGYKLGKPEYLGNGIGANERVFEDPYGIVAVVVYETWQDLRSQWIEAQSALVDLISSRLGRSEAKAWEGYLVLLTPSVIEAGTESTAQTIRYDMSRVRKLVATGDDIGELGSIRRVLLPVLPIESAAPTEAEASVLDALPEILAQKGVSADTAKSLIRAFINQESLMDCLHRFGR